MTFLEMVQKLHAKCGCAGSQPSSVTNQTGEARRLVNWIIDADQEIQLLWVTWKFLWAQDTGRNTTNNVATLAKPATLAYWDFDTFRINGESIDDVVEYQKIRSEILDTTSRAQPSRVIVMPDKSLMFEPIPNGAYPFQADFYKVPVVLVAANDVSLIPVQFHNVVIGRAMMMYGNFEAAQEIKTDGAEIYSEFLERLENDQLPTEQNARFKGSGGFFEVTTED
jgi:hypothetical protein